MARGSHLFPFRTQKLSLFAPKVLGWTRPGRLGRCRNPYQETRCVSFFYWIGDSLSLQGWEPPCSEGGHHVPVREAHGRNMIAEAACSRSWRRTRRRCGWHRKGLAAPSCIPAEVCSICRYAKTLLRKASEPAAHVAGFGWHWEGRSPPSLPKGFFDKLLSILLLLWYRFRGRERTENPAARALGAIGRNGGKTLGADMHPPP